MRWPKRRWARRSSPIQRAPDGTEDAGVVTHMRKRNHIHTCSVRSYVLACVWACGAAMALSGCTSADSDLQDFIHQTEQQPGGHVEPLPEVKPYETFVYDDQNLRSPFVPSQASA